jgi:hypothetical protein
VDLGVETAIGLVRLPRLRQNLETTKAKKGDKTPESQAP